MHDARQLSGEPSAELQRDLTSHAPGAARISGGRDAAMPASIESLELRPGMPHPPTRHSASNSGATIHFNCARCGLTITPKTGRLTLEQCPRCAARHLAARGGLKQPSQARSGSSYAACTYYGRVNPVRISRDVG